MLVSAHPYSIDQWALLFGYTALGVLFLALPGRIANRVLLRTANDEVQGQLSFEQALRVGLILLGLYFAVDAAFWLFFTYARGQMFYDVVKPFANSRGPGLGPDDFAKLSAHALEFLLGIALWVGNRVIAKVAQRFE